MKPTIITIGLFGLIFLLAACGDSMMSAGDMELHDGLAVTTGLDADLLAAIAAKNSGTANCKSDRIFEVPSQILSVTAQSSMRIHVEASQPQDRSGGYVNFYKVVDDAGVAYYEPHGIMDAGRPVNMHYNFEGLKPGAHYRISVFSSDGCATSRGVHSAESAPFDVTMPALAPETNIPSFTKICWGYESWSGRPVIIAQPRDDTAVARFQVKTGSTVVKDSTLIDLASNTFTLRGWADADDGKLAVFAAFTSLASPSDVIAIDPFGNIMTQTFTPSAGNLCQ